MSDNGERDELLSKSKNELLLLAKRLLPPKLWPRSSSSKADIADAIQKARRQPKIPSFFAAVPTLKASTSTASTVSSSSPAKKKSKPTDCINKEIASVISGSAKSNEAEEVASVISGSAKSDEAEEEGIAYLVIEDFALDEESKTPPPDPSRLEANRNQIEILGLMRTISNKNAATLDITCPLPSLFCQCAQWFIRLPDLVKKTLQNKKPPQPFVIFDIENACERYPGKSDKELEACPRRTYTRSISSPFVLPNATAGFTIFPTFKALVTKKTYVECTKSYVGTLPPRPPPANHKPQTREPWP
jgi:hypothetical protein